MTEHAQHRYALHIETGAFPDRKRSAGTVSTPKQKLSRKNVTVLLETISDNCFELGSWGTKMKEHSLLTYFNKNMWCDETPQKLRAYSRSLVKLVALDSIPHIHTSKLDSED